MIREIRNEEKNKFNEVVDHPVQSWEWGEFRHDTKLKVKRVGFYSAGRLNKAIQVTFHPLPFLNYTAGYFPKGFMPNEDQLAALKQLGEKNNALFIKMEPEVAKEVGHASAHRKLADFLLDNGAVPGRPLFSNYSFMIDLKKSETELFAALSSKTRYNVNLAARKGVKIVENSTDEGLKTYLEILGETTQRKGFYAHTPEYFEKMWHNLKSSGMMKIFNAVYEGKVLVSWIIFIFNDKLYYPYGASRSIHRDVMASNLLMWEMILYGKQQKCTQFDLWGCLGPKANSRNAWYGFHRFKKGYGGQHLEYLGSYDLVFNQPLYKLFRIAETWRWRLLRLKTKLNLN
jgi:lipid II:glycine glycyltransferase (peptidoglycan interpeptide bridge formation enzyme)